MFQQDKTKRKLLKYDKKEGNEVFREVCIVLHKKKFNYCLIAFWDKNTESYRAPETNEYFDIEKVDYSYFYISYKRFKGMFFKGLEKIHNSL